MPVKTHTAQVGKRFIKAIKQLTVDQDTTVSKIAVDIGAFQENMSAIEKGQRYPTIEMLCNLCLKYGVSPAWLLLNTGEMFRDETLNIGSLFARMNEIEERMKKEENAEPAKVQKQKRKIG
jgi:transcriptional regulator with XRE-family HTH domain